MYNYLVARNSISEALTNLGIFPRCDGGEGATVADASMSTADVETAVRAHLDRLPGYADGDALLAVDDPDDPTWLVLLFNG